MKERSISVLMSVAYRTKTDVKVLFSLTIIHRYIYSNIILFSRSGAKKTPSKLSFSVLLIAREKNAAEPQLFLHAYMLFSKKSKNHNTHIPQMYYSKRKNVSFTN